MADVILRFSHKALHCFFFLIKWSMTKNYQKAVFLPKNAGFTLIELLVVVLIIGILAAVAVPQYQKAVWKSKASKGFIHLRALRDALQVYYWANGYYPVPLDTTGHLEAGSLKNVRDNLDFSLPQEAWDRVGISYANGNIAYINIFVDFSSRSSASWSGISIGMWFMGPKKGKTFCNTGQNDSSSRTADFCRFLCGTSNLTDIFNEQLGCYLE